MAKDKGKTERVLVGTYRPENEAWIRERRLYNLPLPRVIGHKEHKDRKDGRARCPQRAEAGDAALSFGDLGDCPRSWRFDRKGRRVEYLETAGGVVFYCRNRDDNVLLRDEPAAIVRAAARAAGHRRGRRLRCAD